VEVSAVPIEYDYRPSALVFFRDITQRKKQEAERVRLEEQLRHSQKMESVGRLAGGVAHDFNNLLTVINGYSQLLLDLEVDQGALRDGLEEIRAAGDRAASLTQQLLVFSRKQIVEFKPLNVNDVVRQEEKMLRRLIGENIEIVTSLDPSLGLVMADAGHVHQVLMNLTVNARDAMPEGGRIAIATWNQHVNGPVDVDPDALPGPYAVLSVSDSGTGMTPDVMQRIFEPFFTTKPSGSGTGLGLSTVYGIVRQSKGFVSVSSKVGQGSVFRIFLPWTDHPVQCRETEAVTAEASGHGTALLVEDQEEVRKLAALVLAQHGYDVLEARDSAEALAIEASHAGAIHVLLTDMVMPGMSGLELGDLLRQRRADLRVVYMSGYSPGADTECSIPAASFLAKPFTPAGLLQKVRQATSAVSA
jgi:nitrogen-specific signal transduction histidine kinase/ActR/RegA family two-component response regulator